jgi:TusA-related sulfurtransferase
MQEAAASEDEDFKAMNERGARAMGFDQYKTTHHFRNLPDGGAIEVTVNDPKDTMNLDAIRKHFRRIASEFAEGNFTAPLETHGELPPGAANMQKLKSKITYSYEELPNGARVHIATSDPAALQAIHEFFGYQIKEHRTGD